MAKAYFIGGTPRVGKTTLAMHLIQTKPMLGSSTDAIRYLLRRVVKEEDYPDLFHLGKYTSNDPNQRIFLEEHPQEMIDIQNNESRLVWESVNNFVKSNLEDGFDIVLEGIAILPELLSQVDYDYSVVFLGNQSDNHFQTILNSARNNPDDWMHDLEDETIKAFFAFNQAFSLYIQQQAKKFNYNYIEIHDDNFTNDINEALSSLLS